jgi:lipopolysaccharide transport system ATP-binding protein
MLSIENVSKRYVLRHLVRHRRKRNVRDLFEDMTSGAWRGFRRRLMPMGRVEAGDREAEEFWAVRDVNLTVRQGEVVGIIGRNGAGKSTLLKLLSRITEPTEGRIRMNGRVASLLEVGTGFHPELSGRENIYLNGAILGMTRAEITRKFDEIVAFSECERFLDTPVKRYSSGMYVRLAFAVAAHLEPEILIVDEVLAVGDLAFQHKCLGKMNDVAREGGRTVLFVSHNMATVQALCPRVVLLEGGRIIGDGPSREVVDDYVRRNEASTDDDAPRYFRSDQYGVSLQTMSAKLTPNAGGGSDLSIVCRAATDRPRPSVKVGICLRAANDVVVCNYGGAMSGWQIDDWKGEREIAFHCPDIDRFLGGGKYTVDMSLSVFGEDLLKAERVASFLLPARDLFGTGKGFQSPGDGIVPLPIEFGIVAPASTG